MLSSPLETLLKVSQTTSPQNLVAYDSVTLYVRVLLKSPSCNVVLYSGNMAFKDDNVISDQIYDKLKCSDFYYEDFYFISIYKNEYLHKGSRKKVIFLVAQSLRRGGGVKGVLLKKKELFFQCLFLNM